MLKSTNFGGFFIIYKKKHIAMDETIFKTALAAISSGEYDNSDVKVVSSWLVSLNKEELNLIREMEKEKKEFTRNKNKSSSKLRIIKKDIKQIKEILKTA